MNIYEAWNSFLIHKKSLSSSPHTIKQYGIDGRQFYHFALAKDQAAIDNYFRRLCLSYRTHLLHNLKNHQTINRKLSSLRSFVQYCRLRDWLQTDFSQDIRMVEKRMPPVLGIQKSDQNALVELFQMRQQDAPNEVMRWMYFRNQCIMTLMINAALKPSEMSRMKWVHYRSSELFLPGHGRREERIIPLPKEVCRLLEEYRQMTSKVLDEEPDSLNYMWTGMGRSSSQPVDVKTIERILQMGSEHLSQKYTSMNLKYSALISRVFEEPAKETFSLYGYSQKAVLNERRNKASKKKQTD